MKINKKKHFLTMTIIIELLLLVFYILTDCDLTNLNQSENHEIIFNVSTKDEKDMLKIVNDIKKVDSISIVKDTEYDSMHLKICADLYGHNDVISISGDCISETQELSGSRVASMPSITNCKTGDYTQIENNTVEIIGKNASQTNICIPLKMFNSIIDEPDYFIVRISCLNVGLLRHYYKARVRSITSKNVEFMYNEKTSTLVGLLIASAIILLPIILLFFTIKKAIRSNTTKKVLLTVLSIVSVISIGLLVYQITEIEKTRDSVKYCKKIMSQTSKGFYYYMTDWYLNLSNRETIESTVMNIDNANFDIISVQTCETFDCNYLFIDEKYIDIFNDSNYIPRLTVNSSYVISNNIFLKSKKATICNNESDTISYYKNLSELSTYPNYLIIGDKDEILAEKTLKKYGVLLSLDTIVQNTNSFFKKEILNIIVIEAFLFLYIMTIFLCLKFCILFSASYR